MMRFDSITLEIVLTPVYFLFLLILLTLLFHSSLVWFGNIKDTSEVFLKQIDYIWLVAAVVGLVSLSHNLNKEVSAAYLENLERPRTEIAYESLRQHLEVALAVCAPQLKGIFSPSNFDEINEDRMRLCVASKNLYKKMPKSISEPYPTLEALEFKNLSLNLKVNDNLVYIKETNNLAESYRKQQARYEQFRIAASPSNGYDLLRVILGPFLLAFALAIRITKVTAEVKLARAKQLSK